MISILLEKSECTPIARRRRSTHKSGTTEGVC
jgi:hypothetical protein